MAVRIRMKKLGRRHRPFYRICAVDQKRPRDGRVLEELGTYDPMLADVDARAVLKSERVAYWLGVGARPSDKVAVLIKKYGVDGTHKDKQQQALERLAQPRAIPEPGKPTFEVKAEEPAPAPAAPEASAEAATEEPAAPAEAPADEAPAAEAVATEEAAAEQKPAEGATSEEGATEEVNEEAAKE